VWLALLAGFFGLIAVGLLRWAKHFAEAEVTANYRTAMRLAALSAAGFSAFVLVQLVRL